MKDTNKKLTTDILQEVTYKDTAQKLSDVIPEMRRDIRNSTTSMFNIYDFVIGRLIELHKTTDDKELKKKYQRTLRRMRKGMKKNSDFLSTLYYAYMSLKVCPTCSKGEKNENN